MPIAHKHVHINECRARVVIAGLPHVVCCYQRAFFARVLLIARQYRHPEKCAGPASSATAGRGERGEVMMCIEWSKERMHVARRKRVAHTSSERGTACLTPNCCGPPSCPVSSEHPQPPLLKPPLHANAHLGSTHTCASQRHFVAVGSGCLPPLGLFRPGAASGWP